MAMPRDNQGDHLAERAHGLTIMSNGDREGREDDAPKGIKKTDPASSRRRPARSQSLLQRHLPLTPTLSRAREREILPRLPEFLARLRRRTRDSGRVRVGERPASKDGLYIGVDPRELPDLAVFKDLDAPWCPEMVVIPAGSVPDGLAAGRAGTSRLGGAAASGNDRLPIRDWPIRGDLRGVRPLFRCDGTREAGGSGWGRGRRPVIKVSWWDAQGLLRVAGEGDGSGRTVCHRKRSGSMRAGPERTTPLCLRKDDHAEPGQLRRQLYVREAPRGDRQDDGRGGQSIQRTPGVFTSCTAMSGNGWRTSGMTTMGARRRTAQHGRMKKEYNPLLSASTVAAPGPAIRGSAVPPSAAGTVLTFRHHYQGFRCQDA